MVNRSKYIKSLVICTEDFIGNHEFRIILGVRVKKSEFYVLKHALLTSKFDLYLVYDGAVLIKK